MGDKSYTWKNLKTFEKQHFIDRAHAILIAREKFIPPKYIYNDNGKAIDVDSRVKNLANQLFEQSTIEDYDKGYYYPPSAAELVDRYDIEISDIGVVIPTGDREEAKRIKKALILLLKAPAVSRTVSYKNSWTQRITKLLTQVDEEK